ncbi:hypothetical protein HFD88_002224 [Aspergillus terreus]|uniref:Transcriptional regulator n=1 Tax=Aspergillus terreus var. terreus TaxID=2081996 RepID=A0A7D7QYF9_ASPTE|nr:hypothetical protein HFD88_002224 [Aspergillus terreus]QMS79059.1 hypothetical protein [Aspergillus terreus var. terreus]
MYTQPVHAESSTEVLLEFIRQNPLGVLTTGIPSAVHPFLQSTHIPFVLDQHANGESPIKGSLRGHMARQNPQSKAMIDSLAVSGSQLEQEVMVLFTDPHHHYVTPKFYTETKPQTGKVAPTWNYSAVQVYGKATVYYDSSREETSRYLAQQLHDLSQHCETNIMGYTGESGREAPWTVDEAPEGFLNILKKNIIGVEVSIERIQGKYKMSQERVKGDREGVIEGFKHLQTDTADYIARMVEERGAIKDQAKQ